MTVRELILTISYASIMGNLMSAQVCIRANIVCVVSVLRRYLSNPSLDHWKAIKKVLTYLQGTKDFVLTYQLSNILDIVGYSNADYAGCPNDRKSTSGYIFMMAGGAISVKQTLTASSTMEQSMWHVMRLYAKRYGCKILYQAWILCFPFQDH